MQTLSGIAFGLIAGVIGWIVAEFLGKPLRRGLALIEKGRKELIRLGNVPPTTLETSLLPGGVGIAPTLEQRARTEAARDTFRSAQSCKRSQKPSR